MIGQKVIYFEKILDLGFLLCGRLDIKGVQRI